MLWKISIKLELQVL